MIRQSSPPVRRRPMAVKMSAARAIPSRPTLHIRWTWVLLAVLSLLAVVAVVTVVGGLVLAR